MPPKNALKINPLRSQDNRIFNFASFGKFLDNFQIFENIQDYSKLFEVIQDFKFEFEFTDCIRKYSNSYSRPNNEFFRIFSSRIRIMSELTLMPQSNLKL